MSDEPTQNASSASGSPSSGAYAVLARKYRPQDFDSLIGQEALVRILTNAFAQNRIPHAMLLTGVRGVGKTTTARIVAKGLNCSASDGPTIKPCGRCENCVAIAESRHVDVMEMDAASRTGIDDIREIIESVRYRSNMARYKVYIVDETHMLSKSAFNGLLKTLEEPPPHVKFILATTDAHKVPATVLSRCMRFDLRRVEPDRMIAHLASLCAAESVEAEREALALVARASEGSVRDALSLLDQAIAHGAGAVKAETVRQMLGLSDAGRVFELFEAILQGAVGPALERFGGLYRDGGDPAGILRDLASVCHLTTLAKAVPERAEDETLSPVERRMSRELAEKLPMRALSRAWQMLLKGIEETVAAPAPLAAAEMAVIRMTYIAELPTPEQALRRLRDLPAGAGAGAPPGGGAARSGGPVAEAARAPGPAAPSRAETARLTVDAPPAAGAPAPGPRLVAGGAAPQRLAEPAAPRPDAAPRPAEEAEGDGPRSFEEIVALIRARRDGKLLVEVESYVRPGRVGPNSFEFTPAPGAPERLAGDLMQQLRRWTGARWVVSVVQGYDGETLAERKAREDGENRGLALAQPLAQAVLAAFPEAALTAVRPLGAGGGPTAAEEEEEPLLARYEEDGAPPIDPEEGGYQTGDWEPDPYGLEDDDAL